MFFSKTDESTTPTAVTTPTSTDTEDGVTVYTLQGTLAGRFSSLESARLTLKRGVYVAKGADGDSRKFTVR